MDLVLRVQTEDHLALALQDDEHSPESSRTYQAKLAKVLNNLGLPIPDEYHPNWKNTYVDCYYKRTRSDARFYDMFDIGINNARRSKKQMDKLGISSISLRRYDSLELLDSSHWTLQPDVRLLRRMEGSELPSSSRGRSASPRRTRKDLSVELTSSRRRRRRRERRHAPVLDDSELSLPIRDNKDIHSNPGKRRDAQISSGDSVSTSEGAVITRTTTTGIHGLSAKPVDSPIPNALITSKQHSQPSYRDSELKRELWDVRRQLTALKAREEHILRQIDDLGSSKGRDFSPGTLSEAESSDLNKTLESEGDHDLRAIRRELSEERKSKVEIREDLLREQKRRLDLEDCLDHANRRLDEYPVMVPAVQEALEMLSLLTEGVMLAVHGHGV
ncbi:unnamed protein product [Somion occarium]|uniref:Uncharacterized protein n=1 Tax=Somion occarium TaxID=3059160 RepID=A0ABP1DTH9_9APHY